MACTPCARRRKAAQKAREKKAAEGKKLQAAAIGAALAVTEAVGKAIGIHGEVEDGDLGRTGQGNPGAGER